MQIPKIIIVTGGAGFVGSNLINILLRRTKFRLISIDNYSSGSKKNEIKNPRVKYINADTKDISKVLNPYKKNINAIFHFGEFSRIYQSFLRMKECINSNTIGSNEVFNFCLSNKIKLIYSATSASIGNKGKDKNLSPYAFTKAKNLELLENLKKWFNFKYEIIYFYNVYGPGQIKKGSMASVIGIFEDQFKKKIPLTVVRPGSQSRRFTHVFDTVEGCYYAWKKNMCQHYSMSHKKAIQLLKLQNCLIVKLNFFHQEKVKDTPQL
jgi:UDP-glucose 4-epimerase